MALDLLRNFKRLKGHFSPFSLTPLTRTHTLKPRWFLSITSLLKCDTKKLALGLLYNNP